MAELKITELDELTTPAAADLLEIVDDVAGTPTSKKVTLENIYKHLVIGSDADGDMYYRASSVLARLAKGSANHKLFMHASDDKPEWASGLKIGSFTREMDAASGDVSITGVGFKPTILIFFGGINDTATINYIGVDDGTSKFSVHSRQLITAGAACGVVGSSSIVFIEGSGKNQAAFVKTRDSDGFTLTWTRTGATASATATGYYAAIR